MATGKAIAAMAMFFLVALSTSHTVSSLRPGTGLGTCSASGYLLDRSGNCEKSNDPDCCEDGKKYPQYRCSPPVTASTKAVLTLNSFEKGKDGGGPSECDNAYHKDKEMVVALSTGWFSNRARCGHQIKISANGNSVYAKVVDECDSVHGCDHEHNFVPPCDNNIVDASPAVWNALGLDQNLGMVGHHLVLTLNSFEKGKDGGGPSECDNKYHSDEEKVVALSTGWFNNMARCGHKIKISANGNSVYAKVVDECDSVHGCDDEHNFEPPCDNNIVDASPAVWNALGLDQNLGMVDITWSEE